MPKLEGMRKPGGFDFLENAVAGMTQSVTAEIAPQLERLNQNTETIVVMVANAIKRSLSELAPTIQEIAKGQQATASQTAALASTQRALVEALGRVQFPDHSEALRRIEGKTVDFSSLEEQVQALGLQIDAMREERPREWQFKIERNDDGTIKSVEAYADEDDE